MDHGYSDFLVLVAQYGISGLVMAQLTGSEELDFGTTFVLLLKVALSFGLVLGTSMKFATNRKNWEVNSKNNFFLKNFMDEVSGVDIGFSGKIFTWCNRK